MAVAGNQQRPDGRAIHRLMHDRRHDPIRDRRRHVPVDPDGEQVVKPEFRLTVLPVEFVRLNVIVSAARAAVASPKASKSAAIAKLVFRIMDPFGARPSAAPFQAGRSVKQPKVEQIEMRGTWPEACPALIEPPDT